MLNSRNNYEEKLKKKSLLPEIINLIHGAQSVREIIVDLKLKILTYFNAERITIYAIDTSTNQLFSLFKEGNEIKKIVVPKSHDSIVGYCALSKQTLNISDAYDDVQLKLFHPKLQFDKRWDKLTGFLTKQVLASPILYENYRMGVIQILNSKDGNPFHDEDLESIQEIARTLGIAFYNQRRMARPKKPNKYSYLIEKGLISESDLEDAVSYAKINNRQITEVIIDKYHVAKEEVLKSLSDFYNTEFFIFDGTQKMPSDLRERLNDEYLKKIKVAPLYKKAGMAYFAVEDPSDLAMIDTIKVMRLSSRHTCLVALAEDIISYINLSYGREEEIAEVISDGSDVEEILGELSEDDRESTEADEGPAEIDELDNVVVRLANQIIKDADKRGASDIHIEPNGKKNPCRIRFRVDGSCQIYKEVPASHRKALISRYKIMSKLNIAEKRKPQDGKIKFKMRDKTIELRVATIPTASNDEDIVMRILAASKPLPLDKMGFNNRNLKLFKNLVSNPYGMVLCVGPTGSGKTTTLHSALGYINTPEKKIWTAEDPVEITQAGLRQVQVKPAIDFTFEKAMRAFLRADPDVIMIGEMRDKETAHIGVEASLTGHLVLSTLHTNSAPETVTRLLDLGIDAYNFADSLLGILAQRLVRKVCKDCKKAYHPEQKEYQQIVHLYGEDLFPHRDYPFSPEMILYGPDGCPECAGTGYRGRMGLHELLESTDEFTRLVQKESPVEELKKQAMADGMTTLMQDGIIKVLQGHTDLKQVRAVCIR